MVVNLFYRDEKHLIRITALEAEVERLREYLGYFVHLDWDGIISECGGTPMAPGKWRDWAAFMVDARAALESAP